MRGRIGVVLLAIVGLFSTGVTTAQAVDNPNAPASVAASSVSNAGAAPSAGRLRVTWQKPVVDGTHPIPISYEVVATAGAQTVRASVGFGSIATTDFEVTLDGLTGGTAYTVTVTGTSSNNGAATSAGVTATPVTSPAAPTTVSAVASPGSVALTWSAPSNNGGSAITGYIIKNGTSGETTTATAAATTKTVSGLTAGSSIIFSILAINNNGKSEYAAFASATLPSAPDKPTGVTATANTTSISVSWVAPTVTGNSAITGYKVYLYDNAGAAVGSPTSASTTSVELTNVSAGTYTVKVKATNLVGDSPFSDASLAATIAAPSSLLDNTPVFTPSSLPNLVIGTTQNLTVTVPSSGTVTITATGSPSGACTYANGVITAVAEGTCSIRATSPATSTYAEAAATKTFSITKTLQTITFAAIANQPLPGPLTVSATSTSGLTVSFAASGNCTVTGTTVSFTGQGTCTVTASQAGNGSYAAATSVSRTFSITAASSGGGGSGGGGGGSAPSVGGGGGGGGVGTTWFNLFIADPDDFTKAFSGEACAYFIHKVKEGDKTYGPICASKSGALDYEANDGDYIIRTFDKAYPTFYKEYNAKVTFGTFEVNGAGYRGGSVPRRSITVLKKSEHPTVVATPSPSATPTPTTPSGAMPVPAPKPSASASPSPSPSAKPTGYVIGGKVTGVIKTSTLTAATTNVTLKLSANFQAVIPTAKKGEKITMTIKDPKGKSFNAPVVTVAKAGSVKLPSVKFSVAGKYTITIKVGTKTKTVTLTATK
jgi:hypothetical protein